MEQTSSMANWWYKNKSLKLNTIRGRFFLLLIVFFPFGKVFTQQNLIPNPGFELKTACPDNVNNLGLSALYNWYPHTAEQSLQYGSPDYFNICSPLINNLGAPLNFFGYQHPRTDSAYVGLGIAYPYLNYREFIRIELSQTLKSGQAYCIGLHWSRAEYMNYACSNLSMVVSQDSFLLQSNNYSDFSIIPTLSESSLMEDTLNWRLLEGHFIAEGGEKWLTIGWFFDYSNLNITKITDKQIVVGSDAAYYYIDDVFLYECDQYGIPEEEIIVPNVFTPNNDGINDFFFIDSVLPANSILYVYNRWGELVFQSDNYQNEWDGTTPTGAPCSEGTYFYILQLPKGTIRKGTVNIFR